jgi:hypothetical protein
MRNILKHIIFLAIVILTAQIANAQNIEPAVRITQDTNIIRLGEQAAITIEVVANASDTVVFPQFKDTITGHIEIAEVYPPDTTYDDDNITIKELTQKIKVTSFDSGVWVIPPISVVVNGDTLQSDPLILVVQTVEADTTKPIKPIVEPYQVNLTFLEWLKLNWHWLALAIGIIMLIIGLIYYLKNRKTNEIAEEPQVEISLDEQIWNRIQTLEQQKLWQQGNFKEYYSQISELLRFLLEKTLYFNALELPTADIVKHLKYQAIEPTILQQIKHILTVADLAKYAKEQPIASENELVLNQLKNIAKELLAEYNRQLEKQKQEEEVMKKKESK